MLNQNAMNLLTKHSIEDSSEIKSVSHRRPNPSSNQSSAKKSTGKRSRQQNRVRKDESQIQLLIQAFKKNTDWSKEEVTELSQRSGLTESQVYKWAWDQKKKLQSSQTNYQVSGKLQESIIEKKQAKKAQEEAEKLLDSAEVIRDEFGGYCCKRWGADKEDNDEVEEDLESEDNIWK